MSGPNPYQPPSQKTLIQKPKPLQHLRPVVYPIVVAICARATYLVWLDMNSPTGFGRVTIGACVAALLGVLLVSALPLVNHLRRRQLQKFFDQESNEAMVAMNECRFEDCIHHLDNIIPTHPYDMLFHYRGIAYKMLGDYRSALENFERANDVPKPQAAVVSELSKLLSTAPLDEIRDGARAEELALKSIELGDPENHALLAIHAAALAEQGRFDDAISIYEESLANTPDDYRKHSDESFEVLRNRQPLRCAPESDLARFKTYLKMHTHRT